MAKQSRETLKNYFRKGSRPEERYFTDFIDSTLNIVDEGLVFDTDKGLSINPSASAQGGASGSSLLNFAASIENKSPVWDMAINKQNKTLAFRAKDSDGGQNPETVLSLHHREAGQAGVGVCLPDNYVPKMELEVNGTVGMKSRVGTYRQYHAYADGDWHNLFEEDLKGGCYLFEIVAGVGIPKTGKYALMHAFAATTFMGAAKKDESIRITQDFFGNSCHKMELRWTGGTHSFNLQLRTKCAYRNDEPPLIKYYIGSLWTDTKMEDSQPGAEEMG